MELGIIIQARMGSTRLPGKILKKFYGEQNLLDILLDNLNRIDGAKIIVATSTNVNNDALVSYLDKKGVLVYRGSENDVLDRFIQTAELFNINRIIRICSDNPFLDRHGIEDMIAMANSCDADYIGYRINGKPSILTHFGFWGEFVKLEALKRVATSTPIDSPAHEHVTYHIYNHPDEYECKWILCPDYLQGRNDIRLTIDTYEDLCNAQKVYKELKETYENFTLKEIVDYLDRHKDIKQSMLKNISQNNK